MRTALKFILAALAVSLATIAAAKDKIIGVSWSNFQEERWKTDEASMKAAIEAAGNRYISADAQSSSEKQLEDIDTLIAQGADALILLSQDASAITPAVQRAIDRDIPVISYDRLIDNKDVFYLSFDNREVGRIQARELFKIKPEGNYAFIKGSQSDPNTDFVFEGQMEVLKAAVDAGKIKNVGEAYTDGWATEGAQRTMEQLLMTNGNAVDAVLAANDGTAAGVVAALSEQGLAGSVPVSGQDGDHSALNRVALGTQTVTVWKDARQLGTTAAEIASQLADGTPMEEIPSAMKFTTPSGNVTNSVLLSPVAITKDNLNVVIDAGWVSSGQVCQGVTDATVPACDTPTTESKTAFRPALDVCFASDRQKQQSAGRARFSHERSNELTLGFSKVSVPLDRNFGDSGRPRGLEWVWINYGLGEEDPKKHFIIKDVRALSSDEFRSNAENILTASDTYKNHVIVFVHGFNVQFDEAIYTTAQLATDMNFDGLTCTYSWPSMGGISPVSYNYDTNSARQTRDRLSTFLGLLSDLEGADHVSIIAHSMGSVALIEALRQRVAPRDAAPKPYSQIVLAAPDMDRDDFRSVAGKLAEFSKGVTLYASSNDVALIASKRMAASIPRAGDVLDEGPIVMDNIDSIDASAVSNYLFGINHSYYASDRNVISDIAKLLFNGERPLERNPTFEEISGSGGMYWRYPK